MPSEFLDIQSILLLTDVSVYVLLGLGVVALRLARPPRVNDVQEAFQLLDSSIAAAMPDLPRGYTWREALVEMKKKLQSEVDWTVVERGLAEYEAFRYGGEEMPREGKEEVVKLATRLRRRIIG